MVTTGRVEEYHRIIRSIVDWAQERDDIVGIAVVGSWARDEPRMSSDVDLVVLTAHKARYVSGDAWVSEAIGGHGEIVRIQAWGPLTEFRVALSSGLEIEFGFVAPDWGTTEPLDPGTAGVVRDGCAPLYDPEGAFDALIAAAGRP